jgi:hypothetical protein
VNVTALPEKETFTCQFFIDTVLDNFDKELAEKQPKKRARDIFCIWIMHERIEQMMILIVSALQDYATHLIARISHYVTSGYSET